MNFEEGSFEKIKQIVAHDTLLNYPNFNEKIKIHANASAFQLGAVISQKGKPIAFYCIKLNDSQQRYTVKERELLSIRRKPKMV